jgi:Zn-dependent peptidase ImmA (M78 family)
VLRRGFKTEANTYAREMRGELSLESHAPLCPFRTAAHLGVEVRKLTSYKTELPDQTAYLTRKGNKIAFSAITACLGTERFVIYNDTLAPTRCHADIMHEISHMLLMHPPHRLRAETGDRHYDAELEEQANWLGPAMLVSEEAALSIVQRGLSLTAAAKLYGVSADLMRMRLNVTGAHKRVVRAA